MIDVGTYLNELDLTVVNRDGKDVTHCYRIDAEFGMLIIRKLDVTFTTNTELHVYNGKYVTPSSYVDLSQFIAYGHNWANVSFTVSEMLPGTYESSVEKTVRIVNADGRDVTHNFNISYKFGNLIINRRPIRIKSPSNSKVYDGTAVNDPVVIKTTDAEEVIVSSRSTYVYSLDKIQKYSSVGDNTEVKE